MNIGELKRAIADMDDDRVIVLACAFEDADGDEVEQWFGLETVEPRVDPDTADDYAHFTGGELLNTVIDNG